MLERVDNSVKLEDAQDVWNEFLVVGSKLEVLGFFLLSI